VVRLISVEEASAYFDAPAGRILDRDHFFCASPDGELFSLFAWGDLGPTDTDQLIEVLRASVVRTDRTQLVVLSDVTRVSPLSIARLVGFYASSADYAGTVRKEAVVRPEGLVGMLAEGFYPIVPLPFAGTVVRDLESALSWLGATVPPSWLEAVRAHLAERQRRPEALERAQAAIRRLGARASLIDVAREVGQSARTLQRRLQASDTSFERLRTETLVREAERRLLETPDDIKRIAFELGYRSPARFTEAFTRVVGVPPARYRAEGGRAAEEAFRG